MNLHVLGMQDSRSSRAWIQIDFELWPKRDRSIRILLFCELFAIFKDTGICLINLVSLNTPLKVSKNLSGFRPRILSIELLNIQEWLLIHFSLIIFSILRRLKLWNVHSICIITYRGIYKSCVLDGWISTLVEPPTNKITQVPEHYAIMVKR